MSLEKDLYKFLAHQYKTVVKKNLMQEHMPIKYVKVLESSNSIPTVTETYMVGNTINGYQSNKVITVNDTLGTTDEYLQLYDKDKNLIDRYSNGFTAFRCSLMTCVAIQEAAEILGIPNPKNLAVGFIGNGMINQFNAKAIESIFGISRCVIHGSRKERGKNKALFPGPVSVDRDTNMLNICDVIISCTNDCSGMDMITEDQLSSPKIIISLDGGYTLDESFRKKCNVYSDHVKQLAKYYDEEFAFDRKRYPILQLCKDRVNNKGGLFIYLFGTGFADAVIAEGLYKYQKGIPINGGA